MTFTKTEYYNLEARVELELCRLTGKRKGKKKIAESLNGGTNSH